MSLNAISTATAGLAATQAAINVVSQNVANAGTAGYVKRTLSTVATGPNNSGVAVGHDHPQLRRCGPEAAPAGDLRGRLHQHQVRTSPPNSMRSTGRRAVRPRSTGTLNTFTESLQELAANPTSAAARTTVLGNASALASLINSSAGTVQNLRTGIESQLGTDTTCREHDPVQHREA